MYNVFKNNLFFYLSAILTAVNIGMFSNNINKREKIIELETQIQDLKGKIGNMSEGEQQERKKSEENVAELEAEIQNLETVIANMREHKQQEKQKNEQEEQRQDREEQEKKLRMESLQKLEGQEVSEKWDTLAYGKYIRLIQQEEEDQKWIASRIWEENGMENGDADELKAVCPIRVGESEGEIYLFHYFADDVNVTDAGNYCAIWINRQTNGSEILFHTEGSHAYTSLYEFYDMQVSDVDENGEEDVILLLGAHRSAGAEYYLPDLYCMIARQKNGKFQCISNEEEEWLEEALHPLYIQQNESRKINNIMGKITAHYGNGKIEATVEEEAALEEFIAINDEKILKKLDERSLFFERELLWETYDIDQNNHIQGIKVYKEKGENGMPQTQVAVYLFDYMTEEVEKREVPEVYQEITDQGESIEDVELEGIEVKEIDGIKNICMQVEIVLGTERLPYEFCIK